MVNANKISSITPFQTDCGKAVERFLTGLHMQAPNTAVAYRGDITRFFNEVFNGRTINTIRGEDLEKLNFDTLFDYQYSLHKKVSNSTTNRHLSSIKSLIEHLKSVNIIKTEIGYLDSFKRLPEKTSSYKHMTREIVEEYMNESQFEMHDAEQKRILIMTAVDTALRQAELLALEWDHFFPDGDKHYRIEGRGKGNKPFKERISKDLYDIISTLKIEGQSKVFTLERHNIQDMMNRLSKRLGYENRGYVFHSFKKSAVSFTFDKTGSIPQAMKKGKHVRPETVMIYLEERDDGLLGMFSSEAEVDDNLYKEVSHEALLKGLSKMDKNTLLILNLKLNEIIDDEIIDN